MKYKYKNGDKVRIKPKMIKHLDSIGIAFGADVELKDSVLTINDDTPGEEGWSDDKYDGTPTYSADGWRIPEAFLMTVKKGG